MARHLPYDRAERVAQEIHRLVSTACLALSDPRLYGVFITKVRVTRDLRIARIYFHVEKENGLERERIMRGLQSARSVFKRSIGRELKLKFMPEIEIFYDESVDDERRIDELLNTLSS